MRPVPIPRRRQSGCTVPCRYAWRAASCTGCSIAQPIATIAPSGVTATRMSRAGSTCESSNMSATSSRGVTHVGWSRRSDAAIAECSASTSSGVAGRNTTSGCCGVVGGAASSRSATGVSGRSVLGSLTPDSVSGADSRPASLSCASCPPTSWRRTTPAWQSPRYRFAAVHPRLLARSVPRCRSYAPRRSRSVLSMPELCARRSRTASRSGAPRCGAQLLHEGTRHRFAAVHPRLLARTVPRVQELCAPPVSHRVTLRRAYRPPQTFRAASRLRRASLTRSGWYSKSSARSRRVT